MACYGVNISYLEGSPWFHFKLCCIEKYSVGTALLTNNGGKNLGNCSFFSHQHAGREDN